jgi:ActR/RegA family two-component response regulator
MNSVEKVQNRVSGAEDKDWINHSKTMKKCQENVMEQARHLGHHQKTKSMNHGYRRIRDTN